LPELALKAQKPALDLFRSAEKAALQSNFAKYIQSQLRNLKLERKYQPVNNLVRKSC